MLHVSQRCCSLCSFDSWKRRQSTTCTGSAIAAWMRPATPLSHEFVCASRVTAKTDNKLSHKSHCHSVCGRKKSCAALPQTRPHLVWEGVADEAELLRDGQALSCAGRSRASSFTPSEQM